MEKQSLIPKWISVVFTILAAAAIIFRVYQLIDTDTIGVINQVICVVDIIAYLVAMIYCYLGHDKTLAKMFKLFCGVNLVYYIIALISKINFRYNTTSWIISLVAMAVALCIMAIFLFVPNIGKTRSYILAELLIVCSVVEVFIGFCDINTTYAISMIGRTIMSIIFMIMVYAKYLDKAARGTK